MSAISLPDHLSCTGCGVCMVSCPRSAIQMKKDEMGVYYPFLDQSLCIACGRCQKVCHLNNELVLPKSEHVYAAYSSNVEERATSASGGIAAELYRYARAEHWHSYGVEFIHNECASYKELITEEDFRNAKNSKYVYCDAAVVYKPIAEQLAKGEFVLFVGIPCQVAALISYLGGRKENLITVDLLCHGTCPSSYLDEHISAIEKKKACTAEEMSFRDSLYYTYTYTFTLKNKGKVFYHIKPNETDAYQIGYHKGLIYKENCYHCKYTREERAGDLTIADFSGLGRLAPYNDTRKSVSCVVASSEEGKNIFQTLVERGQVVSDKRPADEAFLYDKMFQHPAIPHTKRPEFREKYVLTGRFESSAKYALRTELLCNKILTVLHIREARVFASKIKHKLLRKGKIECQK